MRGRRSQTNFSRLIGDRSNIARRWEVGACWPAASAFLCAAERARPEAALCFQAFFKRKPDWYESDL